MRERNFEKKGGYKPKKQRKFRDDGFREARPRPIRAKLDFHFAPVDFDTPECPVCGQKILDLTQAMPHKETGEPIHFDCALKAVSENERLAEGEKIAYVGKGKFAVITYPNPSDKIHFKIVRTIEWKTEVESQTWRAKISEAESAAQEITDIKPV